MREEYAITKNYVLNNYTISMIGKCLILNKQDNYNLFINTHIHIDRHSKRKSSI